ncbi:DUF294 nucleotidyltransferase-like domain-containing protein [Pedobacter sp. MW01-1-1]|uniref:DUF294 nucleotidyltransferase-like domain-containing protein n=1 Tax=Pedobacter sp. MW01-1-1 TaxID=3383027 RepID=UPI003FF01A38
MTDKLTFLASIVPFNVLPQNILEEIAAQLVDVQYEEDTLLHEEESSKLKGIEIVVEGYLETYFIDSAKRKQKLERFESGSIYGGISILFNKKKSLKNVLAKKGAQLYFLNRKEFKKVCEQHEEFFDYFAHAFGKLMMDEENVHFFKRAHATEDNYQASEQLYSTKIQDIAYKKIVSCSEDTPIFEAAIKMAQAKSSCLFVQDQAQNYSGFVTDITLRDRVIAKKLDASLPVKEVMDANILSIGTEAFVYEAILLMFSSKSRYLLVKKNHQFIGFLSRNRLLSEQAQSPLVFIQSVKSAVDANDLRLKWQKVPRMVAQMLARGVNAEIVNQMVSTIADTISTKIIESVIAKLGPAPAKFVFMVLGSEGREELSLKTDQDNAIIYEDTPPEERAAVRSYFLDLAEQVSDKLNFVGFVYCKGDYMASNPNWTHSLSHWKYNYQYWIEDSLPETAVKFAAFFDCRAIYGNQEIMQELREFVDLQLQKPIEKFYAYLAKNALQYEAPLTFFKNIRTQTIDSKEVFDIKKAMTPIVDLVRIYALQNRIFQKENTGERLKALKEMGVFSEKQFNELMQSYYYLMALRLKHQAHQIIKENVEPNNFIEMNSITKIEKVTLIEIFKTIKDFQLGIKMRFTNSLN